MRILYFSNEDVPASHAGAVHTWEVARGLARRGHDVTLVSAAAPGLTAQERRDGVSIFRRRSRLAGVKCNLRAAPVLARLWPQRYDVVMERYLTLNGLGYLFAAAKDLPYYVEANGPHVEEVTYRWRLAGTRRAKILAWWADRQFARADGACAPNVNIVRPVARPRARKIIWGVNEDQFSSALAGSPRALSFREKGGGTDRFVILFVGSFRPWQGARDLPAIIARAVEAIPEALFWIVGDGDERPRVEEQIKKLGVGAAVRFLGWRRHRELPYVMAAADAAVAPFNDAYYPPLREFGFFWAPTKVLECLASGLPVVSSRYPILDEMVEEGRSGYLVPAGDAGAFAARLAALARAEDAREMGRYGEAAVKRKFGWRRHCEILEGYLREAVQRRKNLRKGSK
ncbi:MAG TPA: glycosyltransferase family 4 protein [bacterium]|nr:glycosyltransferase family 4 protein [bacterium]